MSEWIETTLGEVADIDSGFAFKSKEYSEEGTLRVVRGKNVTVGAMRWGVDAKFWNYSANGLKRYFLAENDIVIGMDGSKIGENRSKIKASDLPAILAQRVGRVRAKGDNSQEFLWQAINSDKFVQYIKSIHTGTSIPHISQKQIGNFEVLLPSPPEQKAIAEVLSSLDDKIDLLHRQNQTLEEMAETLFRKWFGEGPNTTGYEFGELVESVSIKHKFDTDQVVFLNTSDVYDGQVLHHEYSDVLGLPGQAKKSIQKDDILFTEIRPANRRFAYINFDAKDYVVSTKLMVLRSRQVLDTSIFYLFLKQQQTLDYLQMLAEGRSGTFPQITFGHLKTVEIYVPKNQERLAQITMILKDIVKKTFQNHSSIKLLAEMRDTLLPKLMNGEVKVRMD